MQETKKHQPFEYDDESCEEAQPCQTCNGTKIVPPYWSEALAHMSETCSDCRPDKSEVEEPKWENFVRTPLAQQDEAVNHPSHYGGDVEHEVIKCLKAWGLESDALLWNAVKYIARAGKKERFTEDLEKSLFYLKRRIEDAKGSQTPGGTP